MKRSKTVFCMQADYENHLDWSYTTKQFRKYSGMSLGCRRKKTKLIQTKRLLGNTFLELFPSSWKKLGKFMDKTTSIRLKRLI